MNKNQYEGLNPFFSIIIPLYNIEKYIKRAVNSALKRTFSNIEIIIINDSSTDNSVQEVEKIKNTRIRLLHRTQPGPGGYAARNYGIENAIGEFILAAAKGLSPVITSCFVVKKTIFEASGGFPAGKCKKGGDVDTWLRIALQGDLAWTSYRGMYYYRDIPDQVSELHGYPHVPYVYKGVLELVESLPKKEAQLIKKYANRYSHRNILESLLEHKLTREFLNAFFKEVDILKYLVYKVLYSLPLNLGHKIYVSFKHLKKVFLK